ncbi:MAG: prolipoprotein diacylglyceryl transferase [Opitutales bacterium]|nr:prolipoprotein diacylglyceryl transferase [Opitutales bacterium]
MVNFDPFAFRFPESWGFTAIQGVRWYGLAYLAGFLIAMYLMNLYTKAGRSPLSRDQNSSLITYLLLGVILGGRLGYMLFYDFADFCANPLIFFKVWNGGMASHGGFIGVAVAVAAFSKINKTPFLKIADIIASVAAPGIFLGRIANFINGELWGKISDVKWAMIFPASAPGLPISEIPPRHPSQLYEAVAEGLLIFIILQWRFWRGKTKDGQIAGEFFIIYAAARIFCEIFREPDRGVSLIKICNTELSRGTFFSLFCILAGAIFIAAGRLNQERRP